MSARSGRKARSILHDSDKIDHEDGPWIHMQIIHNNWQRGQSHGDEENPTVTRTSNGRRDQKDIDPRIEDGRFQLADDREFLLVWDRLLLIIIDVLRRGVRCLFPLSRLALVRIAGVLGDIDRVFASCHLGRRILLLDAVIDRPSVVAARGRGWKHFAMLCIL